MAGEERLREYLNKKFAPSCPTYSTYVGQNSEKGSAKMPFDNQRNEYYLISKVKYCKRRREGREEKES